MWSFASHAGAGIAVAGLSATYYALQRKNYQLERGQADDGSVFDDKSRTIMSARGAYLTIPASQMLLKKELGNLARDSGHILGLNSITNKNPVDDANIQSEDEELKQSSKLAIKRIISRAQTNFPKKPSFVMGESEEGRDFEKDKSVQSKISNETENDSLSVFDVEEFSRLEMSEDDVEKDNAASGDSGGTSCGLKICHCSNSNNAKLLQRSKSPVICYWNHGFGKRFACMAQDSSLKFPKSPFKQPISDESYKDSTQFLFPPVLSDSKVSICGDEEEDEHLEEDIPRRFDQSIDENDIDANGFITNGLSRMDEIRDYNLQLKVMQDVRKTQDASSLAETPIPEPEIPVFMSANKMTSSLELLKLSEQVDAFFLSSEPHKKDVVDGELYEMQDSPVRHELENQEPLPSPSTIMQSIPASSWVSLPARLYAESENASLDIIIFLGIVIFVFGIMGNFFFTLSTWFDMLPGEDENNPLAMMEH